MKRQAIPAVPAAPRAPAQQQPAAGELVFDVTEADFEAAVLERSLQVPVLLDCWAPWCAPCRALGPVLEKLTQEYAGQFVLAKLNTDEAPQVSAALRMRSIPLVLLFIGGQPVDQFLGALPEGQVRAFLDKNLPQGSGPAPSPVDELRDAAKAAGEAGHDDDAIELLAQALDLAPGHEAVSADLAEGLIGRVSLDDAQELLDGIPGSAAANDRVSGLLRRIALARHKPPGDPTALAARVAAHPRDFDARFALAALQVHAGDFAAAFEQLLDVVLRDKAEWREKARAQLVDWFAACPDADAVSRGRRYLGMYLN